MLYIIYFNILLKQNLIINSLIYILIWSNLNIASKLSVNQNQLI